MVVMSEIVLHDKEFQKQKGKFYVPIYGNVSCGRPKFIDDYLDGYLEIPQSMIGKGEFFALRAKGDSMVNAGINDGDLLVIKKQEYAEDGQIVVALIDDNVTLKRYYSLKSEKKIILRPENEKYDDIVIETCIIMGIAVKILKDL